MIEKIKTHSLFKKSKKIENLVFQISDLCSELDAYPEEFMDNKYSLSINESLDDTIEIIFKAIKLAEDNNLPIFIGNFFQKYDVGDYKYIFVDTEENIILKLKASICKLKKLQEDNEKIEEQQQKKLAAKEIIRLRKELAKWEKIKYPLKTLKGTK